MTPEESNVVKVICDHLGCVEYDDLVRMTAVKDAENVLKNRDIFTVIQQWKSTKVLVTAKIRRCRTPDCQNSCTDLHLCKFDLLGQCNRQVCEYGHSLESEHNLRVLREHGLHDLCKDQLRVLMLLNDNSLLPNVCVSYNKGSGEFGNCPEKEDCNRLHVCERYLRGLCDGSAECTRCHDFYEPHPAKTLRTRGVSSRLIGHLLIIYGNILALRDHRNAWNKPGARSTENLKSSNRARVPEFLQRNAEIVICLSFIRGNCKHGDKCCRVHFSLPYKWEVEVDGVWRDLPDNEVIEIDYCDPSKIHSVGTEPVCYDTMMQGVHRVRRLSTVSSVIESSFRHTTKWIWYFLNEHNIWIRYESSKEMHELTISSEELEKKYLQYLEDNTHNVVQFTAGNQCYELNFRDMKQRNEMSSTEREVRRRPFFISLSDVRRPRSSHTGVPGFWDKTAIPRSGYQRVVLDTSHRDYVRVEEHFNKTMKGFSILTIERVQNKKLWEDFQTKREQMKKANSHTKYKEAEKLLFHSTKDKNIHTICRQNFDMRPPGGTTTLYGQGCYFSRDAKYSNDYMLQRTMFACRVLVGQYTKGEPYYCMPPGKDGTHYDSCVNDVREPIVYVVFKHSQVYPEFLITYGKSRLASTVSISPSHKANNVISGSTSTAETLATASIPTIRKPHFASLDLSVKSAKNAAPESEVCIPPKPTQGLTSLSRLQNESYHDLCTSLAIPVFSSSDNLLLATKPSLSDNTVQSGVARNQQEPSTVCTSSFQESSFRDLEFTDSLIDSSDLFSCSSDKAKIFDSSPSTSSPETKSKTSGPWETSCSSAHKQAWFDSSLSGALVSFEETHPIKNASESMTFFDDVFNEGQTASSPHKAHSIVSSSTSTVKEFLTSKPDQLSSTELSQKSGQDLLRPGKIPVFSNSNQQLLILGKPALTDRSIHSNPDLVPTQTSQESQKPASHREVVTNSSHPLSTPSSTAWARNHHSASASSELSTMYKTSSSAADQRSRSDSSLSSSSVSFYEAQPSALSSTQTPSKHSSRQQASGRKDDLKANSTQQNCVVQ